MMDRNRPESRKAAGIAAVAAAQRGVFRALATLGVLLASLLSPSTGWSQVVVAPASPIMTVAGVGIYGGTRPEGDGGPAVTASVDQPTGIAFDTLGNLYITQEYDLVVRKVTPDGLISTFAGNASVYNCSGDGGPATNATFRRPTGVAADKQGNVYIVDTDCGNVRKVSPDGTISTVAGSGGFGYSGDGGPATAATFELPTGIAVDAAGNLYIADSGEFAVRKVSVDGTITTVAGSGVISVVSGDGGPATSAGVPDPVAVAVDGSGNLFIAEAGFTAVIREVTPNGVITTVAGTVPGPASGDGGPATSATLTDPRGIAVDAAGNLYIADGNGNTVRRVTGGIISTVAGDGTAGFSGDGGPAASARLSIPYALTTDAGGNLFIADTGNGRVREVDTSGAVLRADTPVITLLGRDANSQYIQITDTTRNATIFFTTDGSTPTQAGSSSYNDTLVLSQTATIKAIAFAPNHLLSLVASGTDIIPVDPNVVWPNPAPIAYGTQLTATQLNATADVPGTFSYSPAAGTVLAVGYQTLSVTFTPSDTLHYNPITKSVSILVTQGTPPASPIITTIAGNGVAGFAGDGGPATSAQLNNPDAVALDNEGNLYIADYTNRNVRKVTPGGVISTFAGSGLAPSGDGGPAVNAGLCGPTGVAADNGGNVYIVDAPCENVRKVSPGGIISTFAGTGALGYSGDGGAATLAELAGPLGIAVDRTGNVYIADSGNNAIRKVTPEGIISTVAGTGVAGYTGDGGAATNAQLSAPIAVAVDGTGNLFLAEIGNRVIRKVTPDGIISTVAGYDDFKASVYGGVAVDSSGSLYLSFSYPPVVRKVTGGIISTVAGKETQGYSGDGGPAIDAELSYPAGLAIDSSGNLYIADSVNKVVRRVGAGNLPVPTDAPVFDPPAGKDAVGQTVTITDTTVDAAIYYTTDGSTPTAASNLYSVPLPVYQTQTIEAIAIAPGKLPSSVATATYVLPVDPIVEWPNPAAIAYRTPITAVQENATANVPGTFSYSPAAGTILAVGYHTLSLTFTPSDTLNYNTITSSVSILVTPGTPPTAPIINTIAGVGNPIGYSGDGGPATSAQFAYPTALARDSSGNLYVSDFANHVVRELSQDGTITTVAGNGTSGYSGDGGRAASAQLIAANGIAVDSSGNLYIADADNLVVRKVSSGGTITTYAGNHTSGYSGDGHEAVGAQFIYPSGLAVDAFDNLYISDAGANVVRKVTPAGIISTVAGSGSSTYSGDTGPATSAGISYPEGIAVDPAGNLYITEFSDNVIRKVSRAGIISTVAGNGIQGYSGDGGPATSAQLHNCRVLAVDSAGNLYLGDLANRVVRKVDTNGVITTVAGNGTDGFSGDGGPATSAQLSTVGGILLDGAGNLYLTDSDNQRLRRVGSGAITPAATPAFILAAGSYAGAQSVTISDATTGATIYFTTDGTTPTPSSNKYTGAISVSATETIKAIAVASGYTQSGVATATYTIQLSQTIAFAPLANVTYGAAAIPLLATASSGLPVVFTVTGLATATGSTVTLTGAGVVTVTATQPGNGSYASANAVSRSFTVAKALLTVKAASVSRPFGVSNPPLTYGVSGFVYADTASVVSGTATLSTIATATSPQGAYPVTFATQGLAAANYSFSYVSGTLTVEAPLPVAAPVFSPGGGTFTAKLTVKITDATAGAAIHFTLDGSEPTASSAVYSLPIEVGSTETIRAVAILNGVSSAISSASYTINLPQCQTLDYSTGFTAAGLTLNGGATVTGNLLQLTDDGNFEARSAFTSIAMPVSEFSTDFTFEILDPMADGFTFTVQSSKPQAVGATGSGLGYAGIGRSAALKFDLHNNAGEGSNSTGTYINGAYPTTPAIDLTSSGVNLHSGHVFAVHLRYLNGLATGTIKDTVTGASAKVSFPVDIVSASGANAYVGFTAGTGGRSATQKVLTWSFTGGLGCSQSESQTITFGALADATYGSAAISLSASASSGLPVSYTVNGPAVVTGSTLTITGAGGVTVTATQAGDGSFAAATAVSRSFTVAKALLTAKAASVSRPYGGANPALTYGISGFVDLDTPSVVSGTATLSTTASATSPQGVYPVTFTSQGLSASNYSFTYVPGVLTVLASPTVAQPVLSPSGGIFTSKQSVTISDATTGAVIHYTLDGSSPTAKSATYTSAIEVSSTETIRAIAILNGVFSAVTSASYIIVPPQCQIIDYSNGFTSAGMTLNGGATITNKMLQLTDGGSFEARSAFQSIALPVGEFSTDFTFEILDPMADGLTFTVQSNTPKAVGASGSGLGYAGIGRSVAFKLDLHNNAGEGNNSTGTYINGIYPTTPAIDLTPAHIDLHSGHVFAVHLRYLNGVTTGTLRDTVTGVAATASFRGDIVPLLGSNAYVGFTAGTGGKSATQNILNWTFTGGLGCSQN